MCGMFWTVALTIYKSDFHLTGTFESGDEGRTRILQLGKSVVDRETDEGMMGTYVSRPILPSPDVTAGLRSIIKSTRRA